MKDTCMDYYFVLNYSELPCAGWDSIPDELWWRLVGALRNNLSITSIGFQNRTSVSQIALMPCFYDVKLIDTGIRSYSPYHGESVPIVATVAFSSEIEEVLLGDGFDQWNCANEDKPVDELVFFSAQGEKVVVIPYENILVFRRLIPFEITMLNEADARFEGNIYIYNK